MAPQASLSKIGKEGFDIIDKFFGKHSSSHRAHQQVSHQYYQPQDSYTYFAPQEAYTARATKAYYPGQEVQTVQEGQTARVSNRAILEVQPARVSKAYYPPPEATVMPSYRYYERTTQSVNYPVYRAVN